MNLNELKITTYQVIIEPIPEDKHAWIAYYSKCGRGICGIGDTKKEALEELENLTPDFIVFLKDTHQTLGQLRPKATPRGFGMRWKRDRHLKLVERRADIFPPGLSKR